MKKVLYSAVYDDNGYPFQNLAREVKTARTPEDITEDDSILVIWGGSDINPRLYNHEKSTRTYIGNPLRDKLEWDLLQEAARKGIPIIGVCRGAQMLCAAAGGYLFQHVDNHMGRHNVTAYDGNVFSVNSIHHQMMAGYEKVDHELLAWTEKPRSAEYVYKDDQLFQIPEELYESRVEPEYIYFNKLKGHAIQWHPEGLAENSEANRFVMHEINARM